MQDEDYLIDGDEELDEGYYTPSISDEEEEESNESDNISSLESDIKDMNNSEYKNKMTQSEMWLSSAYNDIVSAAKYAKETYLEDAGLIVIKANPKHTSVKTQQDILKDMFHKQGHHRMVNSVYVPETPLSGEDIDIDLYGEDGRANELVTNDYRDLITRFIGYLASRDLSKDSVQQQKRKMRHIPAFIIFLFSSGAYDYVINCPTMPEEYQKQIDNALNKIMMSKYDIVEALAKRYDEEGRPKVAAKVRKMQLAWFMKEPATILETAEFSDLDLTYNDVLIYREYRSKFTNTSKAITQEVISDLITVVKDKDAGIYEVLKDKTRLDAINDVKHVFSEWAKENRSDSGLAKNIIWKNIDELK